MHLYRVVFAVSSILVASAIADTPNECLKQFDGKTSEIFEIFPGGAWDNLKNMEGFRVFDIAYNQCRTTADQKFLIPDDFTVEPVKTMELEFFAENFDHENSYKSVTSPSINADYSSCESSMFGWEKSSVSGSFSSDAQFSKQKSLETNSTVLRVSARFPRYKVSLKSDAGINSAFREQLLKIAALMDENQDEMAKYESQVLIRDYGTNIISSILVGGALVKEDYITRDDSSKKDSDDASLRLQAGESFNKIFFPSTETKGFLPTVNTNKSSADDYAKRVVYSKITTYGGSLMQSSTFKVDEWESALEQNLVAIDRSGMPISSFVTPFVLPEVDAETVFKLEQMVSNAAADYYKHNVIYGCTNPTMANFNSKANVDDGSCGLNTENNMFGGVYQTCTESDGDFCDHFSQVNARTNAYSCPEGYRSTLFWKARKSYSAICRSLHYLDFDCWSKCKNKEYNEIEYSVYWCSPVSKNPAAGFLFGGMWDPAYRGNPATCGDFCPLGYSKVTLGLNLRLCFADDVLDYRKRSIPFGGFYSSRNGNPLAGSNKAKRCTRQFSSNLVSIDETDDIYFCGVLDNDDDDDDNYKSKKFQANRLVRPPFMKRPMVKQTDLTTAMVKMNTLQEATLKLSKLQKADAKISTDETKYLAQNTNREPSSQGSSNNSGIIIGTVACGVILVAVISVYVYARRKRRSNQEYTTLST